MQTCNFLYVIIVYVCINLLLVSSMCISCGFVLYYVLFRWLLRLFYLLLSSSCRCLPVYFKGLSLSERFFCVVLFFRLMIQSFSNKLFNSLLIFLSVKNFNLFFIIFVLEFLYQYKSSFFFFVKGQLGLPKKKFLTVFFLFLGQLRLPNNVFLLYFYYF